jgi:uncharacterized protein (UPF0276 family)
MVPGGKPRHHLERVLDAYQVVQHGVSLDIGGPQGPSPEYLQRLKVLARETRTPWVSDHFCWLWFERSPPARLAAAAVHGGGDSARG